MQAKILGLILGIVGVAAETAFGATEILTDTQLFAKAEAAIRDLDQVDAAMALYAYIQRQPDVLKRDAEHRDSVERALDWTRTGLNEAIAERDRLKQQQLNAGMPAGIASTSSGLTNVPELIAPRPVTVLDLKQPVHIRQEQHVTYPLAVRGGGKLKFDFSPKSDKKSGRANLTVSFFPSPTPAPSKHAALGMPEGSAAWLDREFRKGEPTQLLLANPVIPEDGLGATWSAAGRIIFDWKPLHELMRDDSIVYFDVYNDGKGHLVVTKVRTDLGGK